MQFVLYYKGMDLIHLACVRDWFLLKTEAFCAVTPCCLVQSY